MLRKVENQVTITLTCIEGRSGNVGSEITDLRGMEAANYGEKNKLAYFITIYEKQVSIHIRSN